MLAPKDKGKDDITKKCGVISDLNITGWSVMKYIFENPQEHLGRGSSNTSRPPLEYMTTVTPQVILQQLTTSV